ncbi:hypothetical protein NQ318_023621 [Aromia moschata]|uniref:Transposable element P transposase-like RNase H domain-containing protein n=1 Tax=Aromia moschata TaxID=1265417 RepID=A0AAV8YNZ7_9CUCU|nr:hypothetical protein NQ318_023621 [Aromia moschata]
MFLDEGPVPATSTSLGLGGILNSVGVQRAKELSCRERKMYNQTVCYKKRAQSLTKKNSFKRQLQLLQNITTPVFNYSKSQVECDEKHPKGRRFSVEDKILALAFYKRSPTVYRFLSSIFAIPSTSTLHNLLGRIPISPGINHTIFEALKEVSKKMKSVNKYCILLFDEISLEPHLHYNQYTDEVEGLENCGTQTSTKLANHAQANLVVF